MLETPQLPQTKALQTRELAVSYRRTASLILLALWIAVIVLAVVPLGRYRDRSTWQHIAWIPFVSWPVTLNDTLRNVLLYTPLGYLQARSGAYPTAWRSARSQDLRGRATRRLAHPRIHAGHRIPAKVRRSRWLASRDGATGRTKFMPRQTSVVSKETFSCPTSAGRQALTAWRLDTLHRLPADPVVTLVQTGRPSEPSMALPR